MRILTKAEKKGRGLESIWGPGNGSKVLGGICERDRILKAQVGSAANQSAGTGFFLLSRCE